MTTPALPLDVDPSLFDEDAPVVDGIEPDDDIAFAMPTITPEPAPLMALVEVLPADFPLPVLTRFVPNVAHREALQASIDAALGITVSGSDGLQAADSALAAIRAAMSRVEGDFEQPVRIANDLHKRLTSMRGEWLKPGAEAVSTVGGRVAREKVRIDSEAAEARRQAQRVADELARQERQREAEAARAQFAPAAVVQQMEEAAKVATAPPVPVVPTVTPLANTSVVKTWKARIAGTPGEAPPNPSVAEMSPAQLHEARKLLAAIAAGTLPLTLIDINWSLLNARAKAEKGTLAIPGIEAYEDLGLRARPARRA